MQIRNWIAIALILVSLVCLYPGLLRPIMSVRVAVQLPLLGEVVLQERTQSIVQTVEYLYKSGNALVAFLILLFSIVVPVLKAVLLLVVLLLRRMRGRQWIHRFVYTIGKWSMADVFVVGVLLAFLATDANDSVQAVLHEGFYYFLAYCLISLMAVMFVRVEVEDNLV